MEISTLIIVALLLLCAYLVVRLWKINKLNRKVKDAQPVHPELNNSQKEEFKVILPKVEAYFYKDKNADTVVLEYLAGILKIKFNKPEKKFDDIVESQHYISRRLFVAVENTMLDLVLKSSVLVNYLKNSVMRDDIAYESFGLLEGHIDFEQFNRIHWHLSVSLNLKAKLNRENSANIALSSFVQYDKKGERRLGSIPLALTGLPYEVQGEIINMLLSLCQPETAIPIILGNKKFDFYHQQIRDRNPYWVDALLGKTDLQVVNLLEEEVV